MSRAPDELLRWLSQPRSSPPVQPSSSSALPATRLHHQLSLMLLASGESGSGSDPATVSLLARMVQQYLQSLATLLVDAARARATSAGAAAGPSAAAAAALSALDAQAVTTLLRATGNGRAAQQVSEALTQHRHLAHLTELEFAGREEVASWARWAERAPHLSAPGVREGLEERAAFAHKALTNNMFPLPSATTAQAAASAANPPSAPSHSSSQQ